MQESETFFHQLEWPASGARVAGPIVWLRGWVTGKPGFYFTDIRATSSTGVHLGILGLPRTDLAAHFKSSRAWLPAEYIIGVPLPDGPAELSVETMDEYGNWHRLQALAVNVATEGARSPRVEGEVVTHPGGSSTVRVPHLPFHGHLDDPAAQPVVYQGRVEIFGWLLHETQVVRSVFATIDGLVFNVLASGLTDESLATKVPQHQTARHARLRGGVNAPPTLTNPSCLRVYAELGDGLVTLCFARRLTLGPESFVRVERDLRARFPVVGRTILSPPGLEGIRSSSRRVKDNAPYLLDGPSREFPATRPEAALHLPKLAASINAGKKSLPDLPSGRPRRLLLVARTLQPDEATLRALDIARHLTASHRWAARIVVSEDGPLHETFEASGCAVQIVDPQTCFAAPSPAAAETALQALGRQIWWRHLNAVAIFDDASPWAGPLARQHRVPVFEDPADELAWFAPSPVYAFESHGDLVAPIRALSAQGAGIILQAVDQLVRHHQSQLAGRKIVLADARDTEEERLFQAGLTLMASQALAAKGHPTTVAAMICPAFTGHPYRALLSALAADVPLITTPAPLLSAAFGPDEVNFIPSGNPLALAHAIADLLANPAAHQRRAVAARQIVLEDYSPARQLARWQERLETMLAG